MSHEYRSTTYNPPISPEERQRREIANAINQAISQAQQRHQAELSRIQQQHANDRQELQQRLNSLNSQYQQTIRQHQQGLSRLRDGFDKQLQQTINQQEAKRQQLREQLERAFQRDLGTVNERISDLQAETQQAINAANQRVSNLRAETQQAINAVNQNIQTLQAKTQQALRAQQKQINDIVSEIQQDRAKAAATKQTLREAYDEQLSIISQKNHAKYAPRTLQGIQNQLNNIDALPDTAACAILNQCFNSLLTLDANIEQAQADYEARHLITLRTVEEILAMMHENRNVPLTDGNNKPVKKENGEVAKIELDFWTDGEYCKLEKELGTIRDDVVNGLNDPNYSINDLERALQRALAINQRQSDLVVEAIERGNASQARAEMADSIVYRFGGQTFRVIERGYENQDARKAYVLKFDDGTSKIVVIINPEGNKSNQVVIGTVETDLQHHELIEQGKAIHDILRDEIQVKIESEYCSPFNENVDRAFREIYDRDVVSHGIPQNIRKNANLSSTDHERQA